MTHDAPTASSGFDYTEQGIRFDNNSEALAASRVAIWLAMTSAIGWSMTPRQLDVFRQLCLLQMLDFGPHSLLPNVVAELLALSRRPWWDRGVADLPDEPPLQGPA